jgi:hypothetical protein
MERTAFPLLVQANRHPLDEIEQTLPSGKPFYDVKQTTNMNQITQGRIVSYNIIMHIF